MNNTPKRSQPMSELFPTMEDVEKANREQIAMWYRSLPRSRVASEQNVIDRIADRFMNMGGMTPGLRKKINLPTSRNRIIC